VWLVAGRKGQTESAAGIHGIRQQMRLLALASDCIACLVGQCACSDQAS